MRVVIDASWAGVARRCGCRASANADHLHFPGGHEIQAAPSRISHPGSRFATFKGLGILGPLENALLGRAHAVAGDQNLLKSWLSRQDDSISVAPDAWFAKGVLAALADSHHAAIRCFAEAVLRDPTDGDAYTAMASSLTTVGEKAAAQTALQRAELLAETKAIGLQFFEGRSKDLARIQRLSEILTELKRPLEAIAWRGVWVTYANEKQAISESEAGDVLEELFQLRDSILRNGAVTPQSEFVLCGLNLNDYPSLTDVDKELRQLAR